MRKFEIFLSYSWSDEEIAKDIEVCLGNNETIKLHRDKIDIGAWSSIKEYMQSISQMDYTILLISDAYLKSSNCMYEVLEVMRDRNYKEKIFPAVINPGIYKPAIRAEYVKYWQDEYNKLRECLQGIQLQNLGRLGDDLKRAQDISSNIAAFLDLVANINNPAIKNISIAIEAKLKERNFITSASTVQTNKNAASSLFSSIDITSQIKGATTTDFEINQFMFRNFQSLNNTMHDLCKELEKQYPIFQVVTEKNDSRSYYYQFYKAGKLIRNLRIFLDQSFGSMSIGISTDFHFFNGGGTSWNAMYMAKDVDGSLYMSSQFSHINNSDNMSVEDVVKDIWKNYINPYLQ